MLRDSFWYIMLHGMLWRGKVIDVWGSGGNYHVFPVCGIFYQAVSNSAYVTQNVVHFYITSWKTCGGVEEITTCSLFVV
jgi:hypothetical protein